MDMIVALWSTIMSLRSDYALGDAKEKMAWADAGFRGWPAYPSPPAGVLFSECVKCPLPYGPPHVPSFGWQWGSYQDDGH